MQAQPCDTQDSLNRDSSDGAQGLPSAWLNCSSNHGSRRSSLGPCLPLSRRALPASSHSFPFILIHFLHTSSHLGFCFSENPNSLLWCQLWFEKTEGKMGWRLAYSLPSRPRGCYPEWYVGHGWSPEKVEAQLLKISPGATWENVSAERSAVQVR